MSSLPAITDSSFDAEVLKSDQPVLVDFWAPWCGPCRMLHPVLEQVATERADKLKIVTINVDDNVEHAARLGVMSVPALMLFRNGSLVNKTFGAYPKRHLDAWIDDSLGVPAQ